MTLLYSYSLHLTHSAPNKLFAPHIENLFDNQDPPKLATLTKYSVVHVQSPKIFVIEAMIFVLKYTQCIISMPVHDLLYIYTCAWCIFAHLCSVSYHLS